MQIFFSSETCPLAMNGQQCQTTLLLKGRPVACHVARIVLNDYRCIEVCSSFFEAIQRRKGITTMVVNRGYFVTFIVFMEVGQVTGDQNGTHIFQAYQQAVMAWGMAGCIDDDRCAISKHVFVADDSRASWR
jgi:hypothetical protein